MSPPPIAPNPASRPRPPEDFEVTVVAPCHNEEANIEQLTLEIHQALEPTGLPFEIILVDDSSSDGSWELLRRLGASYPHLRAVRLASQCGQSAALWAGMQLARGRVIVTLDADLQNPPSEIPRFLKALDQGDCDCVCGSRVAARSAGDNWLRRVSSRIANRARSALTGDGITDSGCCYRAFKRACIQNTKFFNGAHRFLPALFMMDGFRVAEIPIGHRPRGAGLPHYGVWNRLLKSLPDLIAVRWMKSRHIRYRIADRINPPKEG